VTDMRPDRPSVIIATDGACKGNPGPGGWGVLIRMGAHEKELSGYDAATTNNRMELLAVIKGLEALTKPCSVTIKTDSSYVLDGYTKWLPGWLRKSWRTADNKPVKNEDLWRALHNSAARHTLTWQKVKGHSGEPDNERADKLASDAALTG